MTVMDITDAKSVENKQKKGNMKVDIKNESFTSSVVIMEGSTHVPWTAATQNLRRLVRAKQLFLKSIHSGINTEETGLE